MTPDERETARLRDDLANGRNHRIVHAARGFAYLAAGVFFLALAYKVL
jgi:hypothetical protein